MIPFCVKITFYSYNSPYIFLFVIDNIICIFRNRTNRNWSYINIKFCPSTYISKLWNLTYMYPELIIPVYLCVRVLETWIESFLCCINLHRNINCIATEIHIEEFLIQIYNLISFIKDKQNKPPKSNNIRPIN